MLTPIDTPGGISVVCEQPMGNPIMLNIARPGALRQYYGRNISFKSKGVVTRVTYGYGGKRNSVGTNPNKFVTKPFDKYLHYIASYLKEFLFVNKKEFNLLNLDLSHEFDSCVILKYYACDDLKRKSTMDLHCDDTNNLTGKHLKCSNS